METKRSDFTILFDKLEEVLEEASQPAKARSLDMSREEFAEIDELRRLSLEVEDPEPEFRTTT